MSNKNATSNADLLSEQGFPCHLSSFLGADPGVPDFCESRSCLVKSGVEKSFFQWQQAAVLGVAFDIQATDRENSAAEEIVQSLTQAATLCRTWVHEQGGSIHEATPALLWALFATPLPKPERARRALHAARLMVAGLHRLALLRREEGQSALRSGVALTHGELFCGWLINDGEFRYSACGAALRRASGLARLAGDGELLLDDAVVCELGIIEDDDDCQLALVGVPSLSRRGPFTWAIRMAAG